MADKPLNDDGTEPSDDDPGMEVELDDPTAAEDAPFEYDDSQENLVAAFEAHPAGQKYLEDLADEACRFFDSAWDGCEEYREKRAEMYRLLAGDIPDKEYPYENSAKAHVPILVEGVVRLSSHLIAEVLPDRQNIFGVSPTGPDDQMEAEVLTVHGNWQVMNELVDFPRQMHRGAMEFFTSGDVTAHSFYDKRMRRNRHEVLTCDEFVIPYVRVTTMPDYSDVPFKFRIIEKYRHEMLAMKGDWENIEEILEREASSFDDSPEGKLRQAIAEAQGIIAPDDDENAPYRILHYEGMSELPGRPEAPARPICAYLDPKTKKIAQLYVREREDWRDKIRHQQQSQELDAYRQGTEQHAQMQDRHAELSSMPIVPGSADHQELQGIQREMQFGMGPPPPPTWMDNPEDPQAQPEPIRMIPIEMFSHGVNIENMMGALGLSQGGQLAEFNKTANTTLSQFLDMATLANNWSLIVADGLPIEPGSFEIAPGRINQIPGVSGPDIKNSIIELKPQPANEQLIRITDMMYGYGQSSVSAPDVMSGAEGKSGETYRGITTRLQQAMKQLSVSGGKFADWMVQIFRNNALLNSMYLPDDEIMHVVDHMSGELRQIQVGRQLYDRDYRVTIMADMRFTSQQQRIQEADELVSLPKAVPPLAQNLAYWHSVVSGALRARGKQQMIPLLGPAPPMPTTPFGLPPPPPPGMMPPGGGPPPGAPPPGGPPPPPQ